MPRKASQASKKDTSAEPKNEGGTTRRSGRAAAAATKQESTKDASRSRRSSTAAQTAASVADSKTPKRNSSSRRDSTSPSEGRQKHRRESVESPATRVKSTRRVTGRINYKESDGEDESAAPKYDETFESNEEYDSESDEKNKSKGKTKGAKASAKGRGVKDKPKGGRGRRGRPSKKQQSSDEDDDPIELSEESVEIESETIAKKSESPKESTSRRGRKSKTELESKSEEKSKSSRRSARASIVKDDEPPKKRPSRSLQAKKYTEEEDDDDIEEIHDSKADEDTKPQDGGRKRKRGATESSKRLKEEESTEAKGKDEDVEDTADKDDESKPADSESEKEKKEQLAEESMEVVDVSDKPENIDDTKTKPLSKEEETDEKDEPADDNEKEIKEVEEANDVKADISKDKLDFSNKHENIDNSENLDESMHSFDSDQGSRAEQSISSGLEDSQDAKETKLNENTVSNQESPPEKTKLQTEYQQDNSNSFQELDDSSESKGLSESVLNNEQKQESSMAKKETNFDSKIDKTSENFPNASDILQDSKTEFEKTIVTQPVSSVVDASPHSKESSNEAPLNGSDKVSNSTHVIHSPSVANLHPEDSAPKANGAHDLHNSVSENDQYYMFPGRKYVINAKLSDSTRQTVKDKTFGFVSYNLGITSSDSSIQKEKLLNELNKLDAHIICVQQISKSFYCGILEPSLDALGFKSTFSQPEESEKGMATFYKSSLFRLSGQSETSLKQLIEKELEASSLDADDRMAVKSYVKKCGHVLFTHFATVIGMHSLTVANVQVPPTDISIHALQVSCLVREVVRINGGTSRPFLLGGEFNMLESEAPYQLLRDGYLSNDMIEELQRRKDVTLPGKENAALVNLLWKSFQHPSSTLCSCYKSVLDHEIFIPEQKITSRDLLWYSSDSLYTIGVLDASETLNDHRFSLKADIAFSV